MRKPWVFSQHFSVRASTMLLLYVPVLVALMYLQDAIPDPISSYFSDFVSRSTNSMPRLLPLTAVIAMAFFIWSVVRRNPQLQFLLEIAAALGLEFAMGWRIYW
jgi:hypothetical protein